MSTCARTDQNLLFGILALQMDFISRDALIAAMNAWVLEKDKPLSQILFEQGVLAAERRSLLEALVAEHLKQHGNDAEKSLASVSSLGSLGQDLEQIADPDIQASLAHVSIARQAEPDSYATRPPTVGEPTSAGTRFRILRPHAKGGLGEVFVAQDQELHREVALKEIQDRYADHQPNRTRFVLEAEITGGLEHPGIVPVYGLGQYADGRPFYAMRFIKGDSLQEAIQRFHAAEGRRRDPGARALALRDLLGRFVDVCNAIAYAHARGVLHRDLKPGNVMLGKYGETLVVDWGLAKAAGGKESADPAEETTLKPLSASDSAPTQMGTALGTPAYMSPEQAAGRLDQLGPASDIYSLGATLYCLLTGQPAYQGQDVGEILNAVQRGEFSRPRRLKRGVPAALEAICLRAMALKPEGRYSSAKALAEDVEHWLADEPVSAYREPWRVRAGRWARRHKPLVSAATAGMVVASVALVSGLWWLDQQRTKLRRGVESSLAEVARLQGQEHWNEARAVLGQAKERLGESGPQDLHRRLEQAERDLALVASLDAIRLKRAAVVGGEMDTVGAAQEYAKVFGETEIGGVGGDTTAAAAWLSDSPVRKELVAALDEWAVFDRAHRAWVLEVARKADPDPERDRLRDPTMWEDQKTLAGLASRSRPTELSPQLLVALAVRLRSLGGDAELLLRAAQEQYPGDFWVNFELGNTFSVQGKPGEAVGYYRAALALRPETIVVHTNLGIALRELHRLEEAFAEIQKTLALDPTIAKNHSNLGDVLCGMQRWNEAATAYRKALALDPKLARTHANLSEALRSLHRPEEAVAECQKAIALDPNSAAAHNNLGNALRDLNRFEEAISAYQKAIELDPKLAEPHGNLGRIWYYCIRRLDEAVAEFKKACELDPQNAERHSGLGSALLDQRRWNEAIAEFKKAIELDPKFAKPHYNLGNTLRDLSRTDEAIACYRRAVELNPRYAEAYCNLGHILRDQGRFSEAVSALRRGHELGSKKPAWTYPSAQWLRQAERMAELNAKLPSVLKGEAKPANAEEQIALALLCYSKKRYIDAARFFADAFAAQPKLTDDLRAGNRYNAACCAALAVRQGEDAAKLDDKERARLCKQALDWLRADLNLWAKQIGSGKPATITAARQTLLHWQQDADLAGIRNKESVDKLPEAERIACQKLWAEVAALLKKSDMKGK